MAKLFTHKISIYVVLYKIEDITSFLHQTNKLYVVRILPYAANSVWTYTASLKLKSHKYEEGRGSSRSSTHYTRRELSRGPLKFDTFCKVNNRARTNL